LIGGHRPVPLLSTNQMTPNTDWRAGEQQDLEHEGGAGRRVTGRLELDAAPEPRCPVRISPAPEHDQGLWALPQAGTGRGSAPSLGSVIIVRRRRFPPAQAPAVATSSRAKPQCAYLPPQTPYAVTAIITSSTEYQGDQCRPASTGHNTPIGTRTSNQ
jgi:hypothetical protein